MLEDWIKEQNQLIDWERDAEVGLLTDRISTLSAKSCQREGLSLLNLEVESTRTVLFGRTSIGLQRMDKGPIQQCFKVGDEVSLYNPKLKSSADSSQADKFVLLGLISKVTHGRVEMVVDEFDDHLFEPPLRLDLRSSQKTHTTMKDALNEMARVGMNHKLVNLLFYPSDGNSSLLLPRQDNRPLEMPDLWNPSLNNSQVSAIQCALNAPAVSIIHGPPGTGKTSTLTELILQAVHRGMKVLVCAPSNIAVDTILGRLADYQQSNAAAKKRSSRTKAVPERRKCAVNMVRVGHPARISSKIMKYALDSIICNDEGTDIVKDVRKDIDELRQAMSKKGKRRPPGSANKDDIGVSFAQIKRDQRSEMRSLMKEARQRERAVVVNILRKADIVLSTCVGAGSRLLKDLQFDMVVIDEAAQGLEAACWIPILKINSQTGGTCVLAGDHCQLPPTIKSPQAERGGLSVTLFERIIRDARFAAVVRLLDIQYRMHHSISDWASEQMYHGAIVSHESVAHHTLRDIIGGRHQQATNHQDAPCDKEIGALNDGESEEDDSSVDTLGDLAASVDNASLSEEDTYPVMLLVDTSGLGMLEDSTVSSSSSAGAAGAGTGGTKTNSSGKGGSSHRNFHEAELVKQHVLSLVRSGVKPSQIGVITPYNGQLEVLRELLFPTEIFPTAATDDKSDKNKTDKGSSKLPAKGSSKPKVVNPLTSLPDKEEVTAINLEGLEIKTIDGFQGGEKECILLSLVRSNPTHTVGFLGEKRRINVAVTRAKRHLAVFCDTETCSVDRFMRTLLDHMSQHGDHISAEEYTDYFASGGTGGRAGSGEKSGRKNTPPAGVGKADPQKPAQSTLVKEDFLVVLRKLKDNQLLAGDESKNAVMNVTIPQESGSLHAAGNSSASASVEPATVPVVAAAKESITARFYCATGVLRFPPSVNSYLRMLVHECAEELQLRHRSTGEGPHRCIEVTCGEFATESEKVADSVPSKASVAATAKAVAKVKASLAAGATTAPDAKEEVVKSTEANNPPLPVDKSKLSEEAEESSDEEPTTPSTSSARIPTKAPPAKKKKPTATSGATYVGAGRQSALGRLELQHQQEMKNKNHELDEDALIEAAIQHNQRLAHLHQHRVPLSSAMPNPEKVESKQKLQSKMAEAALARAKGSASTSGAGSHTNPQGPAGGGSGVGRVGGSGSNIFGFGGSTTGGSTSGAGGDSGKDKPSGSGGSRKKVVKKPPPNFGGGVLGKK